MERGLPLLLLLLPLLQTVGVSLTHWYHSAILTEKPTSGEIIALKCWLVLSLISVGPFGQSARDEGGDHSSTVVPSTAACTSPAVQTAQPFWAFSKTMICQDRLGTSARQQSKRKRGPLLSAAPKTVEVASFGWMRIISVT